MRTIYHLGLHKTGSTSLQFFLHRNQQQLARAGILFPPVSQQGLARFNADAKQRSLASMPVLNDYMGHNALAYRMINEAVPGFVFPPVHEPMTTVAKALSQISEQARGAHTLIFCSEDLCRASLMVPAVPMRFARAFGTQDTTLIANIRRPDAAIASWQTQRLRFGVPFAPLHADPPEAWLGTVHFEYRAALEPWLQAFPEANLCLQSYDRLHAQGGSIQSFTALPGLGLPSDLVTLPDTNSGLPYALLEIARQSLDALPQARSRAFISYLERAAVRLELPSNHQVELFAPGTRTALHRAFKDIHEWLCQLTGSWPFFFDLDAMATPPDMHILDVTRQALPALVRDASIHLQDADLRAFLKRISVLARA
jgi:hypothetical protein